mmetsp:Transcript_38806/g.117225  ORF Transcript_38806/g.117225 Transcript_38806/m.117225 type:complete len:246 (+) Transcript_38806:239-976(+)
MHGFDPDAVVRSDPRHHSLLVASCRRPLDCAWHALFERLTPQQAACAPFLQRSSAAPAAGFPMTTHRQHWSARRRRATIVQSTRCPVGRLPQCCAGARPRCRWQPQACSSPLTSRRTPSSGSATRRPRHSSRASVTNASYALRPLLGLLTHVGAEHRWRWQQRRQPRRRTKRFAPCCRSRPRPCCGSWRRSCSPCCRLASVTMAPLASCPSARNLRKICWRHLRRARLQWRCWACRRLRCRLCRL